MAVDIPCALYLHVPWCVQKCPYCDFNSHALAGPLPEAAYCAALLADLEAQLPALESRPLVSVFFGGGTPSLLSAERIRSLLAEIRARVHLPEDAEITLEANPGTLQEVCSAEKLAGFRRAGVNRLSLGIQSFDDAALRALGRIHNRDQALAAARLALARFERVNLDLMFGLPGQKTVQAALADLDQALTLAPEHLSCYQLTLEPNTRFAAFPPPDLPDADRVAEMGEAIAARLCAAGYGHYETSAFARPGAECRHNLNYWRFGDYLGLGAGAHGKLSTQDASGQLAVLRTTRPRHPDAYLADLASGARARATPVAAKELPFEFLMNALRLAEGFSRALFAERTGQDLAALAAPLAEAERAGLLIRDQTRIAPTPLGRRFLNRLLTFFL